MFGGIMKTGIALGVILFGLAFASAFLYAPSPQTDLVPLARREAPTAFDVQDSDLERLRGKKLLFPVPGFDARTLRDSFEDPRGASRTHGALDILAPRGTPVLAVDDGAVAKLHDSVGRGGLTLYHFDPSATYCYYYAHLDRYAAGLQDGKPLRKGDVVGYVGTTGNAPTQAPHLHFAIFKLGPEKRWGHGAPINAFALWAPRQPLG